MEANDGNDLKEKPWYKRLLVILAVADGNHDD